MDIGMGSKKIFCLNGIRSLHKIENYKMGKKEGREVWFDQYNPNDTDRIFIYRG